MSTYSSNSVHNQNSQFMVVTQEDWTCKIACCYKHTYYAIATSEYTEYMNTVCICDSQTTGLITIIMLSNSSQLNY